MTPGFQPRKSTALAVPLGLGVWAAAVATLQSAGGRLLLTLPPAAAAGLWWILEKPLRWILVLFPALLLLPPLPSGGRDFSIHLSPLILLAGMFAGLVRRSEWNWRSDPAGKALLWFWVYLLGSSAVAALYSGPEIAAGSAARVFLFGGGLFVYAYTLHGPGARDSDPSRTLRWLYVCATLAALYACIDFYFQFPAPASAGPQFVWLDSGVFRRAQGLFYEASTLGNFSAFFLVMILVAVTDRAARRWFSWPLLTCGFISFAGALVLSYSRASVINVAIAAIALLALRRVSWRRAATSAAALAVLTGVLLRIAAPQFLSLYFTRIVVSLQYLGEIPNSVLSGRLATWSALTDFATMHPLDLILGIGYKTLPYSDYAGARVADNTYLSLLIETGLVGLTLFVAMNVQILRSALRAARSRGGNASFFGAWFFCFWCGELVQMLSGDLITYWRVLPLYWWVLAVATREASE